MQEQELQEQCRSSERLEHRGSLFFTRPLHFPTQSGSLPVPRWEAPLDEGSNCACFFNPAGHTQLKATPSQDTKFTLLITPSSSRQRRSAECITSPSCGSH
jgi:hypothetical protein